jgi:guanine nucleotide-binding protein G(I)/G(S)/G(T) subunit beta-1
MGGDEKLSDKIARLKSEIATLQSKLEKVKKESNDTTLQEAAAGVPKLDLNNTPAGRPKSRRTLKGHLAKIYAMHWAEDKVSLVSASQDGKLLVWDAM